MALTRRTTGLTALALGTALLGTGGPAGAQPTADEIMARAHLAMFYPGEDMRARVTMRLVSRDGKERLRELTMTRRDVQEGGEQR